MRVPYARDDTRGVLPLPAVAPRAGAWRIQLLFKSTKRVKGRLGKISSPANVDILVLGKGRATAILLADAIKRKPPPDAFVQALATAMAGWMASDPASPPSP